MITRNHYSVFTTLAATFIVAACSTQSVDPKSLTTENDQPPFELSVMVQARHLENSRVSYTLPKGQYVAVLRDASGIFFLCPSGIPGAIRLSDSGSSTKHLRILGGIYIPTAQTGKPRVWIVGAANAAVSGKLDIDENDAMRLGSGCEMRDVDRTLSAYVSSSVNITVLSNNQSAKGIGQNMLAGAISTVLVNRIIGANDGRIVFPPVALSGEIVEPRDRRVRPDNP